MPYMYVALFGVGLFSNGFNVAMVRRMPVATPGRTLLLHQCIVDAMLSIAGFLILTQPPMWLTGVPTVDAILCQLWHSRFLFFSHANVSVCILLFLAMDISMLAYSPTGVSGKGWTTESSRLMLAYAIGYFTCTPDLAAVAFESGKCYYRESPPWGMDVLMLLVALVWQLFPLTCVCAFLRRLYLLRSSDSLTLNRENARDLKTREQTRELKTRALACLITVAGVTVAVMIIGNLASVRRSVATYPAEIVVIALTLGRSVFSTPVLVAHTMTFSPPKSLVVPDV